MDHVRADVCWNCDSPADVTTEIALRTQSGRHVRFRLCDTCYVGAYLPLAGASEDTNRVR
jgi:hypothetical protein